MYDCLSKHCVSMNCKKLKTIVAVVLQQPRSINVNSQCNCYRSNKNVLKSQYLLFMLRTYYIYNSILPVAFTIAMLRWSESQTEKKYKKKSLLTFGLIKFVWPEQCTLLLLFLCCAVLLLLPVVNTAEIYFALTFSLCIQGWIPSLINQTKSTLFLFTR